MVLLSPFQRFQRIDMTPKLAARLLLPIGISGCLLATTFSPATAKPKESKAEKEQRLKQEERDAWLEKIDIDKLDPLSALAIMNEREQRKMEKLRDQFKKYDGVDSRWNPSTIYTQDSELVTPLTSEPAFGPWVEIDGRRVRTVYRKTVGDITYLGQKFSKNEPFEGLEDEQGKILLPCVYREVHVVPGQGVIIRSYLKDGLYESYNLKTGARTPLGDLYEIKADRNNYLGTIKNFVLISSLGQSFELKDERAQPASGAAVQTVAATQSMAPPRKVPLAKLEFISEQGEKYLTLDKVIPSATFGETLHDYFSFAGGYRLTYPITPTGDIATLLLDGNWKPTGDYMPRALRTSGLMEMGMIVPSPFLENGWLRLSKDGKSFGSPTGSLGYMPLGGYGVAASTFKSAYEAKVNDVSCDDIFWVLAYPTADGLQWKWTDPETKDPTDLVWKDVQHIESPILRENWSAAGPLIAVQELNGQWKVLHLPQKEMVSTLSETRAGTMGLYKLTAPHVGGVRQDGSGAATVAELVERMEQGVLRAKAERIAAEKWQKHYDEVERPRIQRENRWSEAWHSGSWSTIESTAIAMGGEYLVEFVEKYPRSSADQLRRAAQLTDSPEKKAAFEERAKEADEAASRAAILRKKALEEEQRYQQTRPKASSYTPTWNNWSNYTDYNQQSAQNAAKLQAMHDYTYGRANNPLLSPFR